MMRHLVEMMLTLEGKQPWARALRDRRSEQGVPLPIVCFRKMRRTTRSDDGVLCGLMRCLCEAVDKEVMRLVMSFV